MFRLACILSLVGLVVSDTVVLNQMVDQLIAGLDAEMVKNGKDVFHIEDFYKEWKYRWHFVKLTGHCSCSDGFVKSLASLRRTGDVSMTTQGNRITLRAALGLGTLEFGFGSCQFKANHLFSITQHIYVSVDSNSIEAQITLVKNGDQCIPSVDHIALDNLGRIRIDTGGGIIHKIEDHLFEWFTQLFHGKIVGAINDALDKQARDHIGKATDLCSKIPM